VAGVCALTLAAARHASRPAIIVRVWIELTDTIGDS
jgi:hypothetical protein